ncbi:hypothetical protein ABZ769_32280 [Streptomyces olivoreticuli]
MADNTLCLGSRDEHATTQTGATTQGCDDPGRVDAAGRRWLAESYADGTMRLRNEASHLCLPAPDGPRGNVTKLTVLTVLTEELKASDVGLKLLSRELIGLARPLRFESSTV